jgi:hypothetical protein
MNVEGVADAGRLVVLEDGANKEKNRHSCVYPAVLFCGIRKYVKD